MGAESAVGCAVDDGAVEGDGFGVVGGGGGEC